jgi:hypothetical protein
VRRQYLSHSPSPRNACAFLRPIHHSGAQACFRYRATDQELRERKLLLRFVHRSWPVGKENVFGACAVSLMEIASGPNKYDLPIYHPSGVPAGRIVFHVRMVQQCRLAITVPAVECAMRALARHTSQASQEAAHRESSYSLTASLTMAGELESQPTRAEFDRKALRLTERAQIHLALPEVDRGEPQIAILARASARAFDGESIHLCVWENRAQQQAVLAASGGRLSPPLSTADSLTSRPFGGLKSVLLGEVWLPVTKVHTPTGRSMRTREGNFDEVLWLHGQRIGRLSGTVRVRSRVPRRKPQRQPADARG